MESTTDHTERPIAERITHIIQQLARMARDHGEDDAALRASVNEAADALRTLATVTHDFSLLTLADSLGPDLLADYENRRVAAAANGGVVGVRTGVGHLDEALNGLQAGRLYLLAAVPGCGKTTLALQMAATVAEAGHPALFVSLENDALDLAYKSACRLGRVSYGRVLKGKVERSEWTRAIGELRKLNGLLYLSTPRETMPDLAGLVEGVMARSGEAPRVVVLDYLQAYAKRGVAAGDDGEIRTRIDQLTPKLRALAETYKCAVVAIASQNRAGYDKGGQAALKESGDLEYGADVVMTLARLNDKTDRTEFESWMATRETNSLLTPLNLFIDKNRFGASGAPIKLVLDADLCTIVERL